jgi:hypothetical protein
MNDEWRRGWPPFIGGGEGVLGKCLLSSWKAPNHHLGALNLADTLGTDVGKASSDNTLKMGLRRASGGAAAPQMSPNSPIFSGMLPLGL